MVSLAIVVAFVLLMILSGTGLVAKDWAREIGVNYAPPSFVGPDAGPRRIEPPGPTAPADTTAPAAPEAPSDSKFVDPLADVMKEIESGKRPAPAAGEAKSVDPLADVMKDIEAGKSGAAASARGARVTLPFGADKWGRDVIAKTIKGSETSIFVGIAAAIVATLIGTVLGALAGYYGRWVDERSTGSTACSARFRTCC